MEEVESQLAGHQCGKNMVFKPLRDLRHTEPKKARMESPTKPASQPRMLVDELRHHVDVSTQEAQLLDESRSLVRA
jgi:hypothetical protein